MGSYEFKSGTFTKDLVEHGFLITKAKRDTIVNYSGLNAIKNQSNLFVSTPYYINGQQCYKPVSAYSASVETLSAYKENDTNFNKYPLLAVGNPDFYEELFGSSWNVSVTEDGVYTITSGITTHRLSSDIVFFEVIGDGGDGGSAYISNTPTSQGETCYFCTGGGGGGGGYLLLAVSLQSLLGNNKIKISSGYNNYVSGATGGYTKLTLIQQANGAIVTRYFTAYQGQNGFSGSRKAWSSTAGNGGAGGKVLYSWETATGDSYSGTDQPNLNNITNIDELRKGGCCILSYLWGRPGAAGCRDGYDTPLTRDQVTAAQRVGGKTSTGLQSNRELYHPAFKGYIQFDGDIPSYQVVNPGSTNQFICGGSGGPSMEGHRGIGMSGYAVSMVDYYSWRTDIFSYGSPGGTNSGGVFLYGDFLN